MLVQGVLDLAVVLVAADVAAVVWELAHLHVPDHPQKPKHEII